MSDTFYKNYAQIVENVKKSVEIDIQNFKDIFGDLTPSQVKTLQKSLEGTQYEFITNADGSFRSFVLKTDEIVKTLADQNAESINSNVQAQQYTFTVPITTQDLDSLINYDTDMTTTGSASEGNAFTVEGMPLWLAILATLSITGYKTTRDIINEAPDAIYNWWLEHGDEVKQNFFDQAIGRDPLDVVYDPTYEWKSLPFAPLLDVFDVANTKMGNYMDESTFLTIVRMLQDVFGLYGDDYSSTYYTVEDEVDGYPIPANIPLYNAVPSLSATDDYHNFGLIFYFKDFLKYVPGGVTGSDADVVRSMSFGVKYRTDQETIDNSALSGRQKIFAYYSDSTTLKIVVASTTPVTRGSYSANRNIGLFYLYYVSAAYGTECRIITPTNGYGEYTYNNKTAYYQEYFISKSELYSSNIEIIDLTDVKRAPDPELAWYALYGASNTTKSDTLPDGIVEDDSTTKLDLTGVDTSDPTSLKTVVQKQLPNLWDNTVVEKTIQPNGTVTEYKYIQVPIVMSNGNSSIVSYDTSTTLWAMSDDGLYRPINVRLALDASGNVYVLAGKVYGTGTVGGLTKPAGEATALYTVYNPTRAQINQFGAWLWSSNFVDQILKLFSDPMQAIIGLHKVYCDPVNGGTENIKVGYLDSGVSSKTVASQYSTVNCGSVSVSEKFNSVFDYEPYTQIELYLPFIGIVPLSTADVMRSTITVTYIVDVFTGACLADVKVDRDSGGGTLYQYGGTASVEVPVSSGSYMGIVASLVGVAGGVAATVVSGGAAAPALIGSAGSVLNAHTSVKHSGGFSGNVGAMGHKKPYLIIRRPQPVGSDNYKTFQGNPSNDVVQLSSCSGFVQFKIEQMTGCSATEGELQEINNLLLSGVLI